jgi:hypothetical protein
MADMHQLENKMRILKLSGMVDTLDMRLIPALQQLFVSLTKLG